MPDHLLYHHCRLCPRDCGVDRLAGPAGYCGESASLRLAFAGLHRGEEPPLSGMGGSGTIFVSGCNLGCAMCQNWQVSSGGSAERLGRAVSADAFTAICLALQDKGAENINIVTGSHAIPAIAQGFSAAKAAGLRIPVLWNSSAYESPAALELLSGHVDIWLPDLKTLDNTLAARFFNAADYPQVAAQAIRWMIQHKPAAVPAGVIIRHLILPGCLESTRAVLRWFADNAAGQAQLSLMSQYTPIPRDGLSGQMPGRFLSEREYDTVLGWLEEFDIQDGFCQDYVTGSDWLPDFKRRNPFSSELSVTVWHFSD
ncbi:MAG: radical SAM protein [Treponema sp.]|nr:radical SAM protein [Treponema sp.]